MLVLTFLIHFTLLFLASGQSQAVLVQPTNIQCSRFVLSLQNSTYDSQQSISLSFRHAYTEHPLIALSINTFHSFEPQQQLSYINQIEYIDYSYAVINYTLLCFISTDLACNITKVRISYVIYDDFVYSYLHFVEVNITINPQLNLTNQYYEVEYLTPLDNYNYSIECTLSGFRGMNITGKPFLEINVYQNNQTHYIFNINFENMTLTEIYYTKTLLNTDILDNQTSTIDTVHIMIGTAYHYLDSLVINQNNFPTYLPFTMFTGIKKFTNWNFSIDEFNYIFNNTKPRQEINIGFTLFKAKACPTNQLYASDTDLCYGLSSAFYYPISPMMLASCPFTCYQCTGPLSTNCKSCLQGHNRQLSGGNCVCKTGFYNRGTSVCKNCTLAITGCRLCSNAANCTQCLTNCTAIGFSPIYCDCPHHVQANYSYNCPVYYYFQPDSDQCQCLPQTYYNSASRLCQPCAFGCYFCRSLTHCTQCIDAYIMVNHTCVYFYLSYALVGQPTFLNSPEIRCLRFDAVGVCLQRCLNYYYQSTCYGVCPDGTFNISFPWLTCQPCKRSCQLCYNYTICFLCITTRYYFNSSILSCSSCSFKCYKCISKSVCLECQMPYKLVNSRCIMEAHPAISCSYPCARCLLNQSCTSCHMAYFLNQSSRQCIECLEFYGLRMGSNGCYQICGDGISINSECDDGNVLSGDGCSSTCKIQQQFECTKLYGKSYCWSFKLALRWQIYSKLLQNALIINLYSPQLSTQNINATISCQFNYQLISTSYNAGSIRFEIQYKESLLQFMYFYSYKRISETNVNKSNLCIVNINNLQNYYININNYPEPLFTNYSSLYYSIINSQILTFINSIIVKVTIVALLTGISTKPSYVIHRFFVLIYFTYQDAYIMPINSYAPYPAIQSVALGAPIQSTEAFINFDSNSNKMVLMNIILMYAALIVYLELILHFWVKICRNMDWKFLTRLFGVIQRHKVNIYQTTYIGYQLICLRCIIQTAVNFKQAHTDLIILAASHLFLYLMTKIHFYFTFEKLQIEESGFAYFLILEQSQNLTLAIFRQFSIEKGSFTPIIIIMFLGISLLTIQRSLSTKLQFNLVDKLTFYLFRIYLLLQILIQLLKEGNWMRGMFNMEQKSNQEMSIGCGLMIGYLIGVGILLGGITNTVVTVCWLKDVKASGITTFPYKPGELHDSEMSVNAL